MPISVFALIVASFLNLDLELSNKVSIIVDPSEVSQVISERFNEWEALSLEDDFIYYLEEENFTNSLEYVCMCVQAEAGNQGETGMRYVIDCILNRFETGDYADLFEVIDEPNQFSCVNSGSIYKYTPDDEVMNLVLSELSNRTDENIKFFRTSDYHKYGVPCFQFGEHYFSK